MNGIKVLSETTEIIKVGEYWGFNSNIGSWIGVVVLALLLTGIIFFIYKAIDEDEGMFFLFALVTFLIGIIIIFAVFRHDEMQDRTTYKIIAEDTVTLNDFFNHYELLGQEGSIYIVAEKEVED